MIEIDDLSKSLGEELILKGIRCTIEEGTICGLVGSNGAGKSTLMRCISGVYHPLQGEVRVDGMRVDRKAEARAKLFSLADEFYFPDGSNMKKMAELYASYYPTFSMEEFKRLSEALHLDTSQKLIGFSKGMRRQAAVILALSARTPYLLLDESFDGLDPIIRKAVRQLLCHEVAARGLTVLISSHSLRELQDLCDQLLFIHKGMLLLDRKTDDVRSSLIKVQTAFDKEYDQTFFQGFEILKYEQSGKVAHMLVRGSEERVREQIENWKPLLLEILPLNLEEIFTCEVEELGYSFDLGEENEDE